MIIRLVVFVVAGLLIFIKFRSHLRSFDTHAPYVFTAFQLLLALMFFNMPFIVWGPPNTLIQALSSGLLLVSGAFAFGGFHTIKKHGKADEDWEDTTELVNRGIFQYIRHPLYASLMLLAVGFFLIEVNTISLILCIACVIFLVAASLVEEKENMAKFGGLYREYMAGTRRYIPFVL